MKINIADTQWDFFPPNAKIVDTNRLRSYSIFIFYLWSVWSVLWLVGSILYIIRLKTGDTNIKMRSPILALLSAFGAEMAFSCTAWDIAVTRDHFPCCLDLYYILIFLPLYFIPFVLRFAKYLLTMHRLENMHKDSQSFNIYDHPFVKEGPWLAVLGIIMSCLLFIANIFQFVLLEEWVNAYGCQLRNYTIIVLAILFVICLIFFFIGFILFRKINDPYHIKVEFISCTFVWICCLLPYLILYGKNNGNDGKYADILVSLMFVFIVDGFFTSILLPIVISYRHPPVENNGDILSTFEEMLLDDECYKIFEEIAQIKSVQEVPRFCRDVLKFRKLVNKDEINSRAQYIFNTYVTKRATSQNNFSAAMVSEIEARLSTPTNDMFNRLFQEVSKLFRTGNFLTEVQTHPRFNEIVEERKKSMQYNNQAKQILAGKSI